MHCGQLPSNPKCHSKDKNSYEDFWYIAAYAKQAIRNRPIEHKECIAKYGDDMPEIRDWRWTDPEAIAKTHAGDVEKRKKAKQGQSVPEAG